MHRGNRLREPGRGHAELFSCLFHGWKYAIDGSLLEALDPECFPQGLPREQLDLRQVRCESWGGFVFICLDPEAGGLRDYLGIIPEHLDPYHFEEWKVNYDCTIEIDCNWKTSVDAFNEAYHLSATHTWTIAFTDDVNTLYDCYDKHTRMIFPEVQPSPRHSSGGEGGHAGDARDVPRPRRHREVRGGHPRGAYRLLGRHPKNGPGPRLRLLGNERIADVR
jgi:phenylpropionate dioxygenase-like ring-hydroxylating dioxygenase large terminal subunit